MFYIEINIFQDKAKINSGNKYNDNFFGLYCICKRPYPDPEDEVRDLEVSTRTVSSPAFTPASWHIWPFSCSAGIWGLWKYSRFIPSFDSDLKLQVVQSPTIFLFLTSWEILDRTLSRPELFSFFPLFACLFAPFLWILSRKMTFNFSHSCKERK